MKKCYVDLDGVLTDFGGAALKYFNLNESEVTFIPSVWDTVKPMCVPLKISESTFWNTLNVSFWAMMPKTEEADMIMHFLEAQFQENIMILSSPANPISAYGKMMWIQQNMPKYYKSGRYSLCKDKAFHAGPYKILVDDSDKNIQLFRVGGGSGVLYPRRWNSHHSLAKNAQDGYASFCRDVSRIL